jgi:hypothetical protein
MPNVCKLPPQAAIIYITANYVKILILIFY